MRLLLLAFSVLALAIVGCGGNARRFETAARARASLALRCPDADVSASYVGGGGVSVSGCGLMQTYTCVDSRSGAVCAPDAAPTGTYRGESVGGADADLVLAAIAACRVAPGSTIHVVIGVDGDVLQLAVGDTCAERVIRGIAFGTRDDASVVDLVAPSASQEIVPATPIAARPLASTGGTEAEAHARAAIEALRDLILACTSGAPTAVVGEWAGDGALVVRLPDARARTPEDGCVRAAATGARIEPAPGTSGSVLHPLR